MSAPRPIRRLAIANRGEAAMRCIRAVKSLRALEGSSLEVVALYTEVDRDAPFVKHADRALPLAPAASPVAAYLDRDALLQALRSAEADAVWPGWGFLAEDPSFVERCAAEGVRFLGPPAAAMRMLGDKIAAKLLADSLGVPVSAWSGGAVDDDQDAHAAADKIGYPLLVKASAGGGGRGIRFVHEPRELAAALRSARAEAASAFGDGRVFLEAAVQGGRHVEVQIAADEHGCVLTLGARDCSVQRRHQKLIEEAPPPGLSRAFLGRLEADARRLAHAVGYRGVGTVEFLVSGRHPYFLEMNPRLQVEHPVTEALTGLDLVALQIRIARGESLAELPWKETGAAIEARVCAEDPDAGFAPTPGRVAAFDPALGPRVRVDSGVAQGSVVPGAFDSLIAKVIATGSTREEARARLACALADFDLLIEGGATNKGFLIDVLETEDFRKGGVDTGWLDRLGAQERSGVPYAVEALVAAAIVAYQRARANARLNFFADPTTITPARIPPSEGLRVDLTHLGRSYELHVYATGSWRYRIHLGGHAVTAGLREEGRRAARLQLGSRSLRLLFDATEAGIRVEIEGRPHRFGWQLAGEVRASTPAMVISVDVAPGDRVEAGQTLGFLEAMKMETAVAAPVAGVVKEVRARRGQQVAAGDVLLVIEPSDADVPRAKPGPRLVLPPIRDPLAGLFRPSLEDELGEPDLAAPAAAPAEARREALEGIREEVRRVFLGYDANPARAERLAAFLEAELPPGLSEEFRWELAALRHELAVVADVDQLFIRSPRDSVAGDLGVSNSARLRMFVRRIRAAGAGLAPEFLDLARTALGHYGVARLEHSDALERAVLRLLATQHGRELRRRLVLAVLRSVTHLARSGIHLGDDRALQDALLRLGGMRGLVSDAVADAALEAGYVIFERPRMEREAERTSKQLEAWLAAAEAEPTAPAEEVLRHLIEAPRAVFDRIGGWLADPDPRRRAIALAAHVRRLYAPAPLAAQTSDLARDAAANLHRLELSAGRVVLAGSCAPGEVAAATERLCVAAAGERDRHEFPAAFALELLVPGDAATDAEALAADALRTARGALPAARFTLSVVVPEGPDRHVTIVASREGLHVDASLHGMHPEAAGRVDLGRLGRFELERCDAPDGI
ncbi:MAG TPA: biotin carboxylase N-terminal domain-containing protein [Myxococcota bacterium]|nr:biotin carboxylase N-terminal domain-containing protein [Myxococcota bacterium]